MGWDIVAIGTHHTLPIHNPFETASRLAPFLNGVISIGYPVLWIYDSANKTISETEGKYKWHELGVIETNKNGCQYHFAIEHGDTRHLVSQIANLDDITFVGKYTKDYFYYEAFDEPFKIYLIESLSISGLGYFSIQRENVDFDISFPGRWFQFEDIFQQPYKGENKIYLDDFRKHIFGQLKACGCDKAYYFPDQGFGEWLDDATDRPSDEWIAYLESRTYIKNDNDDMLFVNVQDYINGKIILRQDQNLICAIDDFSDLK